MAFLARIKFDSKEKEKLQKEFEAILDYISKLKEAGVGEINDREASKTTDLENIVREDEDSHKPAEFSEDLLKGVPEIERGFVKVKHVLE